MIASIPSLHQPTFIFSSSASYKVNADTVRRSILFPYLISTWNSVSTCGFSSKRSAMTELVKVSAFRGAHREESNVTASEVERFIYGASNGFLSRFAAEGFEATLNRLSKWLITGLFGALLLWTHDAEALWAVLGFVINSILSVALKKILNQQRPVSTLRSDPGMPSSHSQSIFFIFTFTILSVVESFGVNEFTLIFSAVALAFGSYCAWLRVSQQLHTTDQVVVGAVVGFIFSLLWFWSWNALVLEAFMSSLAIRIIVTMGASSFCLGFLIYVIRYWLPADDER